MRRSHIDVLQYCTLTPYPGTRLFGRLSEQGRLLHTDFPADWDRYDLTEILFEPTNLKVDEYEKLMRKIGADIYSRKSVAKRFLRSLLDTRSANTSIWCFFTNRIYAGPNGKEGASEEKFWRLSQDTWPIIKLYQKLETYF